jgi:hypothetical protein
MHRSPTIILLLITALVRAGVCQQYVPSLSVATGVGNAFGGIGVRGEVFVARTGISVLAGAGILPGTYYLRSPVSGAASVRYYIGQREHRLFFDASWSVLRAYDLLMLGVPTVFEYGPGLSLGYSFMSRTGLTISVGAGLGLARHDTIPIAQLGIGWTWRRHLAS